MQARGRPSDQSRLFRSADLTRRGRRAGFLKRVPPSPRGGKGRLDKEENLAADIFLPWKQDKNCARTS